MKCVKCEKEIEGINIFGPIGNELCFDCFLSDGDQEDDDDLDLVGYVKEMLGKFKECPRCNGSGRHMNRDSSKEIACLRCDGKRYVKAVVCPDCNGTGEVDHDCDCIFCDMEKEPCECDRGVLWVASHRPALAAVSQDTYKYVFCGEK